MNLFDILVDNLSCDLAIDLGSTNTLIYRKGRGIVVNEPTLIAVERGSGRSRQAQDAGARELFSWNTGDMVLLKPVRHGVIADLPAAREMLVRYFSRARSSWLPRPLRVVVNAPARASRREKELLRRLFRSAGAREVFLIEEPRAVALGAGLDISDERAAMVVDIGGGITEMAVISGGKVLRAAAIRVGGEHMDQAIAHYIAARYRLHVMPDTAEEIKIRIGDACPTSQESAVTVTGFQLATDIPGSAKVTAREVREALSHPLGAIAGALRTFLRDLPPQQSVDILDRGIVLAGGAALLPNMGAFLERELLYPFLRVKDPLTCLVRGSGDALNCINHFRECGN